MKLLTFALVGGLVATLAASLLPYTSRKSDAEFKEKYGPWAVVAGASEGLGAAWGHHLARRGLNCVLIARREEQMKKLAAEIKEAHGTEVVWVKADLAADDLAEVMTEKVLNGRDVGLVVYNAAFDNGGQFLSQKVESHLKAVNVNVRGPIVLAHVFGKHMETRKQGGGVVLMSSMAGTVGSAHIANYAATKSWNTAFGQGLWAELAPRGIDVMSCIAGATKTPNYLKAASDTRNQVIEQTAEEVVDECAFALGVAPSTPTGAINKLVQILFTRLVPLRFAVQTFSDATRDQMKHV